jgi:transposase
LGVAQNLIRADRDQLMLLPVDVRDWLDEDDIVWHVLEVVESLDLSAFYRRYRANGQGAAAFDPAMMVALVIYAQAVGVRSSRSIERACTRDAGFKVVTGQLVPDHCTITRFLKEHREALTGLFAQVLRLCHAAGMTRVGVIAVDGTKIAANASWAKSYTDAALAHQVVEEQAAFTALAAELLGEQVATDETEDAEHGPDRGDDLPPRLRRRRDRLAALQAARDDLAARDAAARDQMLAAQRAKQDAYDARKAAGTKVCGPRPGDEVPVRARPAGSAASRASVTDPDSRRMKTKNGFVQGYNAQVAVTDTQVILGGMVTQAGTDHHLLPEVLEVIGQALTKAEITEPLQTVLADAGYANEDTFTAAEDAEVVLLAPLASDQKRARGDNLAGERDLSRLPATARAQQRLDTPEGRTQYAMRGRTVEPVFGQLKDRGGMRQFARRGLANVQAEFLLACTVHNLRKLRGWADPAPANA